MAAELVDIHTHLYPASYLAALRARTEAPRLMDSPEGERFVIFPGEAGRVIDEEWWDVGRKLAFMERFGIERSLVSLGNPWLDPFDDDSSGLAREINDEFAALRDETDGRISGMGVLPSGDVGSAAEVAGEIAERDGLHGVASGTRPCGRRLDDEALDPLWEVLERSGLPLFVHPHYGLGLDELLGYEHALPVGLAFPFETSAAVVRMVFGGVFERFPRLRLVASHGGGTLPFLAGRIDAAWRSDPGLHERLPEPPSATLERLFLDALSYHPRAMRATADLVGTGRMAFGTDHPFSVADPAANVDALGEAFDGPDLAAVSHESAVAFFGLAAVGGRAVSGRG